jgi:ribosomal protein L11 methylase PrmA
MPKRNKATTRVAASFRDPSGFLFKRSGKLYRQVNESYRADYELLNKSGLYKELTRAGLLIPHREVKIPAEQAKIAYKILQPEELKFVSYPYEWSFSQLKDAALLTLELQKRAPTRGMWLKDASATNIQFHNGNPILIDSLSFEAYPEGQPWTAYRQFCQHFLAPLALMALKDVRLNQLLRVYVEGIPLDLASRLLPSSSKLNLGLLTHIHAHASAQERYAGEKVSAGEGRRPAVSKVSLLGLVDLLERSVRALKWEPSGTAWGEYYGETNYSKLAASLKGKLVSSFIARTKAKTLWDLGANTGLYSRLASRTGIFTLAADYDPAAVEQAYLHNKQKPDENLLPLLLDLSNPSAGLGWANTERQSLAQRGPADAVMALALIHHLAIGNNVPLASVAEYFSQLGDWLIIEFVPKRDSQVQKLLAARKDIFSDYDIDGFKAAFKRHYRILAEEPIKGSERTLFLMRRSG